MKEEYLAYKRLLYVIFNTNIDEKRNPVAIYDLTNDEQIIGIFKDTKSCAEFLNLSYGGLRSMITRKSIIRDKYRIERIKDE